MSARTSIASQFGIKAETTWGTEVTVDEFIPFVSENLKRQPDQPTVSRAMRANRFVLTSDQVNGGIIDVGGPLEFELNTKNVRTLFKCMFGTETGSSPYTYTPDDNAGDSFTAQTGRPDSGGTVRAFTYAGVKVASWEISATVGETVSLHLDTIAKSESTATALASATYPASMLPYKFTGASLSIAGTAVNTVSEMSIAGDNKLERKPFLGTQLTAEPFSNGLYDYTGVVVTEFESLTQYNRFVLATEVALVMTFTRGASTVVITCNVKFNGSTPNVSGTGVVTQELPFMCLASSGTDGSAITVVYTP